MKYTLMDLIKATYPLRICNFNLSEANVKAGKFKACLEYDIIILNNKLKETESQE
jgi:excinuclease ABC subunit C